MKRCCRCKQTKAFEHFAKDSSRKDGYANKCRECYRVWTKQHYQNNKELYKARRREVVREAKEFVNSFKESNPCTDCGQYYPYYVMEFDHVPERGKKNFNVSDTGRYSNLDKVKAEMDKCDLVCSNCHRERTHTRGYPNTLSK